MSTLEKVVPVFIENEMKKSYIDYSMSVIVSRALPDVRDGLKPVHRRVLFGMLGLGLRHSSAYKKSARIVGEVLGKYHPHGDSAVYDAMVRMIQDFSMRYPLVDGQGNFGSVDGDSPAAMRYTEARLASISEQVLRDLDKETVNFLPNFDETLKEPVVLPSLLPSLLVNGASGIAVGMATNIPPHHLGETIDALAALISNPKLSIKSIMKYVKGPDFPTGALIYGEDQIKSYFETGRGKLDVRAKTHIEDVRGGRQRIVITELPYQVNKSTLIERIAALVRDKKVEGIGDIRDESDREGMRIVIELRKDADSAKILSFLYKHTQMRITFGVILLALINGEPRVLNIKEMLQAFIDFRHDVVLRRTRFELEKAERRAHILEGLKIALDNIDEIIATIRKSRTVDSARKNLMKQFKLSEIQAQAILDMRLQRLTGLERKKIDDEYLQVIKLIERLRSLLSSKSRRMQLVKNELAELKEEYNDTRRTQIIIPKSGGNELKDILTEESVIVTRSVDNTIRRYSEQDFRDLADRASIVQAHSSTNSRYALIFTSSGVCHALRTSYIPLASTREQGAHLDRLLNLAARETIVYIMDVAKFDEKCFLFLATENGMVKRISLTELSKRSDGGLKIITLKDKDRLVSVFETNGDQDVLLASASGKAIRFSEQDVRDMGLSAAGVRGMTLDSDDRVITAVALAEKMPYLLSVTSIGVGKRTELGDYSLIKRGGKGIVNYKISDKTGELADVIPVGDKTRVYVLTRKKKIKRLNVKDVKIMGRASQGMAVVNIAKTDQVDRVIIAPKTNW